MAKRLSISKARSVARRVRQATSNRTGLARELTYNIDNPKDSFIDNRKLIVDGWVVPKRDQQVAIRVRNNQNVYVAKTGLRRPDVVRAHPDIPKGKALHAGFSVSFEFEDGNVVVEVDLGKGYKTLFSTPVIHNVEKIPALLYNKDLTNFYPEHVNLLENRKTYYYEERIEGSFDRHAADPRLMAIYLPQFHPFKENDEAWGRGFTEWSNVATGQPRFIGHQQPILPKDLGFYDLRLEEKILEQIELAKKYGVYGFCFYYYWFSGKKLMEGPLNSVLQHPEWDFNFAICWANENWTKRWDGRNDDIIIAQEYLEEDPLHFIQDVEPILTDKRYVCEDGKPVLMVYRASELKDPQKYTTVWRDYFRKKYKKELQLVSFLSFDDQDPREYGFDAALDFAPLSAFFKNHLFEGGKFPYIDVGQKLLDINFGGIVADYRSIALNKKLQEVYDFPLYPCVTPAWDNDARKKGRGFIFQNTSPDLYAHWLDRLLDQESQRKEAPLIFINAWNEWAEGAIMEPSVHQGHATLNRTVEALSRYSHTAANIDKLPSYGIRRTAEKRLAVIVHLYYPEVWPEIAARLAHITEPYDLFITLNEKDKQFKPTVGDRAVTVFTYIVPNRGRDVLPFLYVAHRVKEAGYEYVLKLHSKKSKHRNDGSSWFSDVLTSLLPDPETVAKISDRLKDSTTGLVGPHGHLVSLSRHMGSNESLLAHSLERMYGKETAQSVIDKAGLYPYFGGTMFWGRFDAIEPILNLYLIPDDFQSEHGQIDGTLAHALERAFGVVPKIENKRLYTVDAGGVTKVAAQPYTEKYTHAP